MYGRQYDAPPTQHHLQRRPHAGCRIRHRPAQAALPPAQAWSQPSRPCKATTGCSDCDLRLRCHSLARDATSTPCSMLFHLS